MSEREARPVRESRRYAQGVRGGNGSERRAVVGLKTFRLRFSARRKREREPTQTSMQAGGTEKEICINLRTPLARQLVASASGKTRGGQFGFARSEKRARRGNRLREIDERRTKRFWTLQSTALLQFTEFDLTRDGSDGKCDKR